MRRGMGVGDGSDRCGDGVGRGKRTKDHSWLGCGQSGLSSVICRYSSCDAGQHASRTVGGPQLRIVQKSALSENHQLAVADVVEAHSRLAFPGSPRHPRLEVRSVRGVIERQCARILPALIDVEHAAGRHAPDHVLEIRRREPHDRPELIRIGAVTRLGHEDVDGGVTLLRAGLDDAAVERAADEIDAFRDVDLAVDWERDTSLRELTSLN